MKLEQSAKYFQEHFFDRIIPILLFSGMILFMTPAGTPLFGKMVFFAFGLFIFFTVSKSSSEHPHITMKAMRVFFGCLLIFSVIFFIATRIILFVRYGEAPLGYDTGFYLDSMKSALESGISGSRVVRNAIWIPFLWLGIPEVFLLHALHVLSQLLMMGALYIAARTFTQSDRLPFTSVLLFLFATSLPQFFAFWWIFFQTSVALSFLIVTLALLHRRSWLAFLTGGFGAAIHPATFFGFVIALGLFMVLRIIYTFARDRSIEREVLFIVLLSVVAGIFTKKTFSYIDPGTIYSYAYPLRSFGYLLTNYPSHLVSTFGGFYLDFEMFKLANIYVLPFALTGLVLFMFKRLPEMHGHRIPRLFFILVFLVVLFVLSYYPFIYQHRHLIYLDLAFIIFASYPLLQIIRHCSRDPAGRVLTGIILVGFVAYSSYIVWIQPPQVFGGELEEIKALTNERDPGAFVLTAEAKYIPWLHAFSSLATIGPAFHANRWSEEAWKEFRDGESDLKRHQLLRIYGGKPVYVFLGHWVDEGNPETIQYVEFVKTNSGFMRISPHVWRYDPSAVSPEDMQAVKARDDARQKQKETAL